MWTIKTKIRNFLQMIGRIFFWGWKMRDNYDYDSAYLLETMQLKLERMLKAFEQDTHFSWTTEREEKEEYRAMVALRICVLILKRMNERYSLDYAIHAWDKHHAKWGETKIFFEENGRVTTKQENVVDEETERQERAEFKLVSELNRKIYVRDWNLLWKLLNEYSRHWWT